MQCQPLSVLSHVHSFTQFPHRHAQVTGQQQRECVQRPVNQFFPISSISFSSKSLCD